MCELLVVAFELYLCVLHLGSSPNLFVFLTEKEGEIYNVRKIYKKVEHAI